MVALAIPAERELRRDADAVSHGYSVDALTGDEMSDVHLPLTRRIRGC